MRYTPCCLVLGLVSLGSTSTLAQDPIDKSPNLDAVFRVKVTGNGVIDFRFEVRGAADQSFDSAEYRYTILDGDGVAVDEEQVGKALLYTGVAYHTTSLPKDKRVVSDYSDYLITKGLRSGEEYYLIVSVRNLTGLAKFKAP